MAALGDHPAKDVDRVAFQNTLACGVLAKAISEQLKPTAGVSEAAAAATAPSGTAVKLNLNVTYDFSALSYIPALGVKR